MDFSHFWEIPLATWGLAAVSVVILVAVGSAKYVFIAVLARWVGKGWKKPEEGGNKRSSIDVREPPNVG